jgi:orotidine-5'-phosphate decarboxylase
VLARPSSAAARIVAALDTADLSRAEALAEALAPPRCGVLKVGLELFGAAGPEAVRRIGARGAPVFLDLKLHDIPNTVAGAVRALLPLRPAMLTLHAAGGGAMVEAARKAAQEAGEARPLLLAVTVLTSLDAGALAQTGVVDPPETQVLRLARLALDNGADGLVCSPREAAAIRAEFGARPVLVVPGVRPAGSAAGDQARTATPAEAVAAGADWIVLGRPLTGAPDPAAAAVSIAAELPG